MRQAQLDDYTAAPHRAQYVAVTGRHPFTTDAYAHGFLTGFREDCTYQADDVPNADPPVLFLDNEFRDPDLDRFLEKVDRYQPRVAVVGDASNRRDAERYQQAANEIQEKYPHTEPIIVPKSRDAFDAIDRSTVVGYPNGYADVNPLDYADLDRWRGRPIHVLGGNPHSQLEAIDRLTQPTIDDQPPSDIIGLDGNGFFKASYYGEYWSPDRYERADHLSIRDTVRRSLLEIKAFWQEHDIWPLTVPIDRYGPAVQEPDEPVWLDDGGGPITTKEELEAAVIGEYEQGTYAFRTETAKNFIEHRNGLECEN